MCGFRKVLLSKSSPLSPGACSVFRNDRDVTSFHAPGEDVMYFFDEASGFHKGYYFRSFAQIGFSLHKSQEVSRYSAMTNYTVQIKHIRYNYSIWIGAQTIVWCTRSYVLERFQIIILSYLVKWKLVEKRLFLTFDYKFRKWWQWSYWYLKGGVNIRSGGKECSYYNVTAEHVELAGKFNYIRWIHNQL